MEAEMLTAEDLVAQERLIKNIPAMDDETLKNAYRQARRDFERRDFVGQEAESILATSKILAGALEDRATVARGGATTHLAT